MAQAAWKVTYRVTARWSKRRNLAIAVARRVTLCVVFPLPTVTSPCDLIAMLPSGPIWGFFSPVIAPNLTTAAAAVAVAALEGQVVLLARNAIAAAR